MAALTLCSAIAEIIVAINANINKNQTNLIKRQSISNNNNNSDNGNVIEIVFDINAQRLRPLVARSEIRSPRNCCNSQAAKLHSLSTHCFAEYSLHGRNEMMYAYRLGLLAAVIGLKLFEFLSSTCLHALTNTQIYLTFTIALTAGCSHTEH